MTVNTGEHNSRQHDYLFTHAVLTDDKRSRRYSPDERDTDERDWRRRRASADRDEPHGHAGLFVVLGIGYSALDLL